MLITDIMKQLNGFYLYRVGFTIHEVLKIKTGDSYSTAKRVLISAGLALHSFVLGADSLYRFKTTIPSANNLLEIIKRIVPPGAHEREEAITSNEVTDLSNAVTEFEFILNAELANMDIYLIQQKWGFDTNDLIYNGLKIFPRDLPVKVPEAIKDVEAAARCIAFLLPNAAAFHLHRANEAVLHRYYDVVTNGEQRPKNRSMGAYLDILDKNEIGDENVRAALNDIKTLHRNPLIHPENNLASIDEAIGLMGTIQSVMVHMLKVIPYHVVSGDE